MYSGYMTSTFLVVTGVHSAGKTSVGAHLRDQGIRCEREMAQIFVEDGRYEFTTEDSTDFQEALFQEERARDQHLLAEGVDAVVISWHVAEIAHSMEKASPDLVERQTAYVDELLASDRVDLHGVHLATSNEEMLARSRSIDGDEARVCAYYDDVRENIFDRSDHFGVDPLVVDNEQGELQRTCERVTAHARDLLD